MQILAFPSCAEGEAFLAWCTRALGDILEVDDEDLAEQVVGQILYSTYHMPRLLIYGVNDLVCSPREFEGVTAGQYCLIPRKLVLSLIFKNGIRRM